MEEDTSTTHPWPPPPPLARSKYYQPTAGRICCALPTHTAERGTKDHGPALGKLRGTRCHYYHHYSQIRRCQWPLIDEPYQGQVGRPMNHLEDHPTLKESNRSCLPHITTIQPFPGQAAGLRPRKLQQPSQRPTAFSTSSNIQQHEEG
jgi:hypothetical protein